MLTLKHLQLPNKRITDLRHLSPGMETLIPNIFIPLDSTNDKKVPSLTFFGELLISSALEVPISLH